MFTKKESPNARRLDKVTRHKAKEQVKVERYGHESKRKRWEKGAYGGTVGNMPAGSIRAKRQLCRTVLNVTPKTEKINDSSRKDKCTASQEPKGLSEILL